MRHLAGLAVIAIATAAGCGGDTTTSPYQGLHDVSAHVESVTESQKALLVRLDTGTDLDGEITAICQWVLDNPEVVRPHDLLLIAGITGDEVYRKESASSGSCPPTP